MSEEKNIEYRSMLEAFLDHVSENPNKLFVVEGKKEISYGLAFKTALSFYRKLKEMGIKEGECVIVKSSQNAATLITDLALQMLHAIYVPTEKVVAAERVDFIFEQTDARFYISDKEMEVKGTWICMKDIYGYAEEYGITDESVTGLLDGYLKEMPLPCGEATGQILFTTGTTGTSKGVEMSNAATVHVAENVVNAIGITRDNIEIIPVPINHAYGLRRYYSNLLKGATIILMDGVVFVDRLWKYIENYQAKGLTLVPASLQMIFKLTGDKLKDYADRLRYLQIGAAVLPQADKEKLCELLPNTMLFDFYGCSEAGCVCTADYNKFKNKKKSLGRPTCNAKFRLLLEDGSTVDYPATGITGRLCYTGSMMMKGYWREPELTAATIQNGYVVTNDLAEFDEDGFITMLGRIDDVINSAGTKIAPTEIEEAMIGCPGIADCAVVGAPDEMAGEVPKMFVVMKEGASLDPVAINDYLFDRLEAYKTPKIIVQIDRIPRTYNGKILRRELKKM